MPPPSDLSLPQRHLWSRIVRDYELTAADQVILRLLCQQLDRVAEAREVLARDGLVSEGKYGARVHPAVVIERNAVLAASRLLRQLGLPPLEELEPAVRRQVAG